MKESLSESEAASTSTANSLKESLSGSTSASNSLSNSLKESLSESEAASTSTANSLKESLSESEAASTSTSDSLKESLSASTEASKSLSTSLYESLSASTDASKSLSKSLSESLSDSASTSTVVSNSLVQLEKDSKSNSSIYSEALSKQALNIAVSESLSRSEAKLPGSKNPLEGAKSGTYEGSLSTAINEYNSAYNILNSEFNSKFEAIKDNNDFLGKLYGEITEQKKEVKKLYEYAIKQNKALDKVGFYDAADKLAESFAKYFLYQQNHVTDVTDKKWEKNSAEGNFLRYNYTVKNDNNETIQQTAYFDYVIAKYNPETKAIERIDLTDDWWKDSTTGKWKSEYLMLVYL